MATLLPANAADGRLAAQFMAADAWTMDCLRLTGERRREMEIAQMLLRLQAGRQAIAKDEAASDRAAWAEHSAVGMMAGTLSPTRLRRPLMVAGARHSLPK